MPPFPLSSQMLEDNDLVSRIDSDNRDKYWFNETDKAFSGKVTLKVNCDLICHFKM